MNLREAFREIQAQFERESHHHPGLRHFWLGAAQFVDRTVLEGVAQIYNQPLVEVTRWGRKNEHIDLSCFVGSAGHVESFKRLAFQARSLFVQILEQLGQEPRHAVYDAPIAWLADLYYLANRDPKPQLRVEQFALGEWPTGEGTNRLLPLPFGEQFEARFRALKRKLGEPIAVHRIQRLTPDVFTASIAMIANIFEEGSAEPRVGTALDVRARESPASTSLGADPAHSDSQPAASGTSASTARSPTPPGWVNQAELIGPCGHEAFAKLMGISGKQLYRKIRNGDVWKERGPSARKFYFYHREHKNHRRLQNDFQRIRSHKR